MSNALHIVQTPYYAAYEYSGRAIGIVLTPDKTTDAAPDRGPPETTREPDGDGQVNYYEEADEESSKLWRRKLGEVLARNVVKRDVLKQGDRWTGAAETSILGEFPSGYKLYKHVKGDHYLPRFDHYLYGSRYVHCFRSPAEFAEHAIWLMKGGLLKDNGEPACACTYCDPSRTQEEISTELRMRTATTRDHEGKDKDRRHRERSEEGEGRTKRPKKTHTSAFIPAKDYTKLNPAPAN